jgi:AcrR family transcriptional regulator
MALDPKYWKALELIEEGKVSFKEIASACKIPLATLYALYEGDQRKMGEKAALFKSEVNKITARNAAQAKDLSKSCKKLALYKLEERLRDLQAAKPTPTVTAEITQILNSLGKMTPNVEISEFSVNNGMTKEELRDEFKRLGALARFALVGRRVPASGKEGPGLLPPSSERGDNLSEE